MENWYALHVRSCCERLVQAKLEDNRVESFFPAYSVAVGHQRTVERPLFPGYVFCRFDLRDRFPIVDIPQVVRILGIGLQPVSLEEFEVDAVRRLVFSPVAITPYPYMATGDRVRIRSGPFIGMEGFVVYLRDTARIVISINLLSRSVSAEVDADSVELLERGEKVA